MLMMILHKKTQLLKVRKLALLSSLTKNETFHRVAIAILKSLSSKHLAVSLGMNIVLLPKIATSIRFVFVFFEVLNSFVVLILKKYENCH